MSQQQPTIRLAGKEISVRQRKVVDKFTKEAVESRYARGKFYNIDFVTKKKTGALVSAKTEVAPTLFATSRSSFKEVKGLEDLDKVVLFDLSLMVCGTKARHEANRNSLSANLPAPKYVSIKDFTPVLADDGKTWVFPPLSPYALEFMAISQQYVAQNTAAKDAADKECEKNASRDGVFYTKIWKERAALELVVSKNRLVEITANLNKKLLFCVTNLGSGAHIDVSKYDGYARGGVGKIKVNDSISSGIPILHEGTIKNYNGESFTRVGNCYHFVKGETTADFIIVSKSLDSYKLFISDFVQLMFLSDGEKRSREQDQEILNRAMQANVVPLLEFFARITIRKKSVKTKKEYVDQDDTQSVLGATVSIGQYSLGSRQQIAVPVPVPAQTSSSSSSSSSSSNQYEPVIPISSNLPPSSGSGQSPSAFGQFRTSPLLSPAAGFSTVPPTAGFSTVPPAFAPAAGQSPPGFPQGLPGAGQTQIPPAQGSSLADAFNNY